MGLQNQLSDVSSESIIILTVVLIGKSVRSLRSLLFSILHALRLFSPVRPCFGSSNDVIGSALAGVFLNLNQVCTYSNFSGDGFGSDCVVCLNRFVEGDNVRKLACRHIFHKDCFDGWLQHLNFNCPLCRAPLMSEEYVDYTRRRVAGDILF